MVVVVAAARVRMAAAPTGQGPSRRGLWAALLRGLLVPARQGRGHAMAVENHVRPPAIAPPPRRRG